MTECNANLPTCSVSTISDALDMHQIPGQCFGLKPLSDGFRLCGAAFTVQYEELTTDGADRTVGDFIDDVPEGSVVVIANEARRDCTIWGDILTATASLKRLAGTVIDGSCRDKASILSCGYPVFALDNYMRTGKGRARLVSVNGAVDICGVRIEPQDIIVGDADGVVAIPRRHARHVLETASGIERMEGLVRDSVANGAPLREARARFKYHRVAARPPR